MPKPKALLTIRLDLLKPQSNPEKTFIKLFQWLLFSGRYIFVFVEALVLIAFFTRFKLDADIAAKKEAIESQIPFIESLKPYEKLIRQTQLQLATIDSIKSSSLNLPVILKKIADQTPTNVKISTIIVTKNTGSAIIHITGTTTRNSGLNSFISGLKEDKAFSNVNLSSIGMEQGVVRFTIDTTTKVTRSGEENS